MRATHPRHRNRGGEPNRRTGKQPPTLLEISFDLEEEVEERAELS